MGDSVDNGKQDYITIVEFFKIEETEENIGVLPDGTREKVDGRKKYKNKRKMKKRVVKHYKMTGQDVLEETIFPGKYIPIVPVYGEEYWKDGKRGIYSLIRKSKGAQRMYNLWKSLETELLLKQPQSPVMAAEGQMAGYESSWEKPDEAMVLYYKQTDVNGQQAPKPERLQPPTIPTGVVNAARGTVDDIKATLGMYGASIGARSNETSGRAIEARKVEGDVATYHFGDNLVKSVTQVGKIIVCMLPEIEDSERVVSVIDKEENFKLVGINGAIANDQKRSYAFKGKYDVRVTTGAPFTTQRQEAAALYNQTIQAMPDLMPIIGDLVFKYQDAPGAQAISKRMEKLVDPKFLEKEEDGQNQQLIAMQQQMQEMMMQAQQQIQALQAELQSKQAEYQIKAAELDIKKRETEIKAAEVIMKAQGVDKEPAKAEPQEMDINPVQIGDSIAQLQTTLAAVVEKKEQQRIQKAMEAQQEAMEKEQERMMDMQEMQEKRMQAEAVVTGLIGVQQTLSQLVQAVSQPIEVVRDEQGNLIGAR